MLLVTLPAEQGERRYFASPIADTGSVESHIGSLADAIAGPGAALSSCEPVRENGRTAYQLEFLSDRGPVSARASLISPFDR